MLFRKILASRLFARTLDAEAATARNKLALVHAFQAAEEATQRFLNHKAQDKVYYYVYKWLVTDFCIKYGFRIGKLITRKNALNSVWLRPSASVAQSTTCA